MAYNGALFLSESSLGDYRKLQVWRRARAFSDEIVRLVDRLTLRDRIRVGGQLGRAAESIRFNISEGAGLNTDPLFAVHVRRSLGSANEVDDQLESLRTRGCLATSDLWLIDEIREIRNMLAVFLRRLEADIARKQETKRKRPTA
jgi:four helix bundle protein